MEQHEVCMTQDENGPADARLAGLNKVLAKALRELAGAGRAHEACALAAEAWSLLRHDAPKEAERLNGLLHYLTAPGKFAGAGGGERKA
jgi:hypothetical protein